MLRRAMLLSVLFGLGMQASVWGDIINVPDDQPTIQAAIDAAADGDEIIVAPGTYFENIDLLGKAVTLRSSDGPEVTTIDANDSGTVVTFQNEEGLDTVIDGFTITGGSALLGGGMMIDNSDPTVTNCIFSENAAGESGGAMMIDTSNPTVTNCVFSGNTANESGGAMTVQWWCEPTVTNCVFNGNTAGTWGGAMVILYFSEPTVTDCTFNDNTAEFGGGIALGAAARPTLINCVISNNTAPVGGGLAASTFGGVTVIRCTFSGNTALTGGGMRNRSSSSTLTHCTFIGNAAENGGGIFSNRTLPVTNCTFSGNTAEAGGGIFHNGTSPPVTNCTFAGNTAVNDGGAIHNGGTHDGAGPTLLNCVPWNNGPNPIMDTGTAVSTVYYSDVEGGWFGAGSNNIDADPIFVDGDGPDGIPGTEDDNLRLSPSSPGIDAADNMGVPADTQDLDGDGDTDEPVPIDLDRTPRFVDDPDTPDTGNPDGIHPIVDMGAYEFEPPDSCADEDGDGSVTICHIPPGNPDAAHTITVSVNALPAHLAHGDHCGACQEDDGLLMGGNSDVNAELCPTDLDDSGDIGAEDVAQLLGSWGPCAGCPADFNADGVVGAFDLAVLLGAWGPCP